MKKGSHHNEKAKKKLSIFYKEYLKEERNHPLYGKHHSKKTKQKMSEAHKGKSTWNKGGHLTKEWKEKIREANKGQIPWTTGKHLPKEIREKISLANKGQIPWLKGKHHSENAKMKISIANKGKNHGNWRGGTSFEPYPIEWTETLRESIRQRDKYRCQLCGMPECENIRKLSVHHIDYNKENLNPKNLISLCTSCSGKTNFKRKHWMRKFRRI